MLNILNKNTLYFEKYFLSISSQPLLWRMKQHQGQEFYESKASARRNCVCFFDTYIYLLENTLAFWRRFLTGLAISIIFTGLCRSFWLGSSASCSLSAPTSVSSSWEGPMDGELVWLSGSTTSWATEKSRRFNDTVTVFVSNPGSVWGETSVFAGGSVVEVEGSIEVEVEGSTALVEVEGSTELVEVEGSTEVVESLSSDTSGTEFCLLAGVGGRWWQAQFLSSVFTSSSSSLNDFWWGPTAKSS